MSSFTYNKDTPPKIIFLTGTGVVKGSWQPVKEALLKFFPNLPEGEENLAFATKVYRLRQLASARLGDIRMTGIKDAKDLFTIKRVFNNQMSRYYKLKKAIADNLIEYTEKGNISLRDIVERVHNNWLNKSNDFLVITTNWDLVLENFFAENLVFHLHGNVSNYKRLYLPSEHSWESYHFIESKGRVPDQHKLITHGNWLMTGVETLIICGLSLSPLDAELNSLLRSAIDRRSIKEVIIIDPNPDPVLSRLRFHTNDKIEKVKLYKPNEIKYLEKSMQVGIKKNIRINELAHTKNGIK